MDGGKQIEAGLTVVQDADRYYGEYKRPFYLKALTPENVTRTGAKLCKTYVNLESHQQEAWPSLGNTTDLVSLNGIYRKM